MNTSISMQFDFRLRDKLHRPGVVVPCGFTSALSQSDWFYAGISFSMLCNIPYEEAIIFAWQVNLEVLL